MEYDPYSPTIQRDPFPTYRWLRDEHPVYYNDRLKFWALSRFDDVLAGLVDWRTYSSAQGVTIERFDKPLPMMIQSDPPYHRGLRSLVSAAFTPRRIRELTDWIRSTTRQYLDPLVGSGGFDIVKEYSFLLPNELFCELFGVPAQDRVRVKELFHAGFFRDGPELPQSARSALREVQAYFRDLIKERRRKPDDGFLSQLISSRLTEEDGRLRDLTDDELLGFCWLLVSAGGDTSAKNIPNTLLLLAEHPDQRKELLEDPSLVPNAVEEALRHSGPAHYQGRWTTRPVEVHGTTIPEGERVVLITAAANRDERQFDNPDRFDIHRKIQRHVAFGFGIHLCIGAHLARMQAKIGIEEFLARFPDYTVDESGLERAPSGNIVGWAKVPVVV
ncbi:cytochrome P450 [Amycolatopsis bartoniae]|uniref:Cytochrome P450 monooxygenase n=1 Tax=Amycolatopsis bartoniae TaxID=941986 RepID=A0A8H9IPQ6_9PSEU|nr:cytochrome P450 [Amycolatopsis bartoniae]MBB2939922.1 cytochrome P450 [Amycolatopsis bartoniae]TVT08294.1 cytochrome P450 [Amycolatopsis bartoniae]GHF35669.1 cytochrome P450 monooxygenase [Amycolatopsis bartoniae]